MTRGGKLWVRASDHMRSGEFKIETVQFRCALPAIDLKQSIIFIAQETADVIQIHLAVNECLI